MARMSRTMAGLVFVLPSLFAIPWGGRSSRMVRSRHHKEEIRSRRFRSPAPSRKKGVSARERLQEGRWSALQCALSRWLIWSGDSVRSGRRTGRHAEDSVMKRRCAVRSASCSIRFSACWRLFQAADGTGDLALGLYSDGRLARGPKLPRWAARLFCLRVCRSAPSTALRRSVTAPDPGAVGCRMSSPTMEWGGIG
jgi:hypothetical protein